MRWVRVWLLSSGVIMSGAFVHAKDEGRSAEVDAKLNAIFQEYLKELFRRQPLTATRLGEHAHDDQLDDLSADARKATLEYKQQVYDRLGHEIAVDKLSPGGRIDYDIFRRHLEREVWLARNFRPFEDDPRIYGDYISESVYLLLTQSSLSRQTNLNNALGRMEEIPAVFATARRTIANPARVKVETAIRQTEGAIGFYTKELFTLAGAAPVKGSLEPRPRRSWPRSRTTWRFFGTTCFPGPRRIGGLAARRSSRSSTSNSTRASRPTRCWPRPSERPLGSRPRWP